MIHKVLGGYLSQVADKDSMLPMDTSNEKDIKNEEVVLFVENLKEDLINSSLGNDMLEKVLNPTEFAKFEGEVVYANDSEEMYLRVFSEIGNFDMLLEDIDDELLIEGLTN